MTEALAPLAHHDHALVVGGPGDVLDGTPDRVELILEDVLLVDGVPNPNLT